MGDGATGKEQESDDGRTSTELGEIDLLAGIDLRRVRGDVFERLFGHPPTESMAPWAAAAPLGRGAQVGRYVILEQIGRGGMAVVYAAYDPELDRKIALKLMGADSKTPSRRDDEAPARMLREAQALARLNHPNVVTVHDVGPHGDAVFVAMERIEGPTLREWMQSPHRWSEVLEVMILAGRGLAAAHAAGILHRDFKPENVMLRSHERSGRADLVCVTDFGLARKSEATLAFDGGGAAERRVELELDMTATGAILGTPAYMAPEQVAGGRVDTRTDQFAFCVTMWEALFGTRPFVGESLYRLARALIDGVPPRPPAGTRVPRWLARALIRGLARDPSARWPSMDALFSVLERGRARARSRAAIAASIGVLTLGAVGYGAVALDRRRAIDACTREGAEISEIWNDEIGRDVAARFASLDTPLSRATAAKLEPWLDGYAEAWSDAARESCIAAEVDGSMSPTLHEAARWCLAERRAEIGSLVESLAQADASAVISAVRTAATLSPIQPCRDPTALARMPAPEPGRADEVLALTAELASARGHRTGETRERAERLEGLLERAESLGWPPLSAAVKIATAQSLQQIDRAQEARRAATDAFHEAARFGDWGLAADAAIDLALEAGSSRQQYEEGLMWSRLAETALALAPRRDEIRESRRLLVRGSIHEVNAHPADAQRDLVEAIELAERAYGADHPALAAPLCRLGITYRTRADYGTMRELCGRAHEIDRRALGEQHPETAGTALNLAVAYHETGDYVEARALYESARETYVAEFGPDHVAGANAVMNLGIVAKGLGDYEEARRCYRQVLATREKGLGRDHPRVAVTLRYLAELELARGELAEAHEHAEEALSIMQAARGDDHVDVAVYFQAVAAVREAEGAPLAARALLDRAIEIASTHDDSLGVSRSRTALGELLRRIGDREGAREQHRLALEIRERELGPDAAPVAQSLTRLGELDLDEGRAAQARATLERAVEIYEHALGLGQDEHDARFALARALWNEDPARARPLAEGALAGHRAAPGDRPEQIAAIEAWLATHPPP